MTFQPLRALQERAVAAVVAACSAGRRAPLVCAPPGSGKTRIGVEFLARTEAKGNAGLWLAPRIDLIDQTVAALTRNGVQRVSVLRGDDSRIDADARIVVATPQTLLAREQRPRAQVVIFDEARHYLSAEWAQIGTAYEEAIRIGLDATPQRQDGTAMGNLFDHLIVAAQPSELIALHASDPTQGIVPARVIGPTARTKALAEDPVQAYLTFARGRRAVVFCGTVAAAKKQAERFDAMGIRAACVEGRMSAAQRRVKLDRFAEGSLSVVTNVFCLCEGWDCPPCDTAILARGFTVETAMIQATARTMRPWPGKTHALVIDLLGCCHALGLPDEDREWTLSGRGIRAAASGLAIRQCPQCGRVFRAEEFVGATCPECRFMVPGRQDPAIRRQVLEQINASHPDTRRTEKLRDLIRTAQSKGYKLGWALMQFKVRYQSWPSEEMKRGAGFYEAQAAVRRGAAKAKPRHVPIPGADLGAVEDKP